MAVCVNMTLGQWSAQVRTVKSPGSLHSIDLKVPTVDSLLFHCFVGEISLALQETLTLYGIFAIHIACAPTALLRSLNTAIMAVRRTNTYI